MIACYVPWLHMHQPLVWLNAKPISNLQKMLLSREHIERWDAKLIARAYKNPANYVKKLKRQGYNPKIMVDYSGILLESLKELSKKNSFTKIKVEERKVGNIIKPLKDVLNKYPDCIEFAGTAYSHCYFPATPEKDWAYQIEEWRKVFRKLFGKKSLERVKGFWLPEMGVPGFEDKLSRLIKTILEAGYEWIILPLQAVEGYEQLSLEKRIQTVCQPHLLKVRGQSIPVIFRTPSYFIDQQSGCDAEELYRKAGEAGRIFDKISNRPALIVPAGDGENGNVMMNEFFPKTFGPFFKNKIDNKISSMLVTEFLYKHYTRNGEITPKSEIKLKTLGASWIGSHGSWIEGTRRLEMTKKIEGLSKRFSERKKALGGRKLDRNLKNSLEQAKKALLIAETSCYVYWDIDFWFDQGEKAIFFAYKKLKGL